MSRKYEQEIQLAYCVLFTVSICTSIGFTLSIVAILRNVYLVQHQDELIALIASMSTSMHSPSEHENVSLISSMQSNSEIKLDYELNQRSSWTSELYNNPYIINGTFYLPDNSIKINYDTYLISELDLPYSTDENGNVNYNFVTNNNKRMEQGATNSKKIQVMAHIHKRSNPSMIVSNSNREDNFATTCYAFNAEGAIWKRKENYYVTPTNNDNLSANTVYSGIQSVMTTWQSHIPNHQIFGTLAGTSNGVWSGEPDGKNEFIFGSISNDGVIAVTITYGIFTGTIANREIIEWDMIFNHIDYNFGDATQSSNKMDFMSILIHEFGHVCGLGDIYSSSCSSVTMYGYSSEGQTSKRSLEQADITGIKKLYGEATSTGSTGGGSTGGSAPKSHVANAGEHTCNFSYNTFIGLSIILYLLW